MREMIRLSKGRERWAKYELATGDAREKKKARRQHGGDVWGYWGSNEILEARKKSAGLKGRERLKRVSLTANKA